MIAVDVGQQGAKQETSIENRNTDYRWPQPIRVLWEELFLNGVPILPNSERPR